MPLCPNYFTTSRAYLVGISNYECMPLLNTPVKDVTDIKNGLLNHEFEEGNIKARLDATKTDFLELIIQMQEEVGDRDRVIFYFAGHGMAYPSDETPAGYLIPADAKKDDADSFIGMEWLLGEFSKLKCKHFLLILDCCFAGAIRWGDIYRGAMFDQVKRIYREKFNRFVSDDSKAWQVITSSSCDEEAIDGLLQLGGRGDVNTAEGNSPFAKLLIDVLNGKATTPNSFADGIITATRLYDYLDSGVAEYLETKGLSHKQTPYYFPLLRGEKGQFIFLYCAQVADPIKELLPIEINNPYKGLASYQNKDSHLFFGRERVVKKLKEIFFNREKISNKILNDWKIMLVSGASGVGKSSLIMAGLIPAMDHYYPGSKEINPIRPGNIKQAGNYIGACKDEIAKANGSYILFVDQFEEMVTICSEKERKQFYDLIEANLASDKCRVIISVRSDFEAQFKDVPLLGAALENKFTVPPFQRDEIEAIIVQPAVQSLLEIKSIEKTEKCDSIFVDGIVDEVMQSPGGLPLLSFALEAWYVRSVKENDNQRILGESDYKKIGGVNGALSTITEKFSAKLNDTEKRYLKRLLLRMVKAEDGSYARRKVYEDEIDFEGRAANARSTQQLLEELIALRVITTNIDDENRQSGERVFYEPAHDSLLTTWKQLTEWIDKEGLGKMMVYRQLANTTDKWINSEKKKNILWDGGSDLDVIRNEFEQPGKSKTDWEKIIHWFKTRYTLGPRMIEADTHIFNKNEKAFIKASVRKTRVGSMVFNWALTIVVILLGVSVYMGVNVYRQSIRNRALYLSSESDKYGDVEKITLLKAAWNIQSDSSISDKIYNYISSHEYSDPLPIANFNTGTIFDSIYFKNDSTITFHNNAGREKDWSLPASAVTKDTTLDLKPTVVADDSKSIIKITTSFGGKNVVKKITNRKLLDYAVADENIAMISASPDYDYFIDFIGKNGENSIAIDDNHIEPVFLSGKKFIAYRKNYKGVVSDLSGHIIDSSTWEYHNVKHIYRSGGNTYELYSIFLSGEGSAGKMTLWYNDLKTRKTIAKTVFSDDSYFLEPQVDILQTNDSTCILAFRYQGNEGSDRSNGQSTRIRRWNLNSNKLVPIYDESKYYDRLEFVNDTTVFFSDAELWHVVVSLNSGEIDSLKLHPIKIRPENHGKYYYFVEKTALGFTSHLYDHKLRKIFSSEYSQAPVSEAISADNKFISIGFGDKNIYVWQLSNYFDPKPDGGALSDGPSANNFEIEEYDIDNDGSVIRISGHVNSGSGGLGVNYHSDPSIDHFNIDSFFKNYKNPYPYMRFEDIGTADKDLKKQVQEFNEAVEKKFAMSKAIRRSAYHYKDRSVYFIDSKIIIATPPGKLEVVKEESSPIVTGRLFDFGNKIMYVLQNGEIHFFRPKTDFKEFINKIDITLPAALRRRYKIN